MRPPQRHFVGVYGVCLWRRGGRGGVLSDPQLVGRLVLSPQPHGAGPTPRGQRGVVHFGRDPRGRRRRRVRNCFRRFGGRCGDSRGLVAVDAILLLCWRQSRGALVAETVRAVCDTFA